MCLARRHNAGHSVSSQALYHCATAIPEKLAMNYRKVNMFEAPCYQVLGESGGHFTKHFGIEMHLKI